MSPFHARRGSYEMAITLGIPLGGVNVALIPQRRRFHRDLYLPRDFGAFSRDTRLLLECSSARTCFN
jgi:hypothetical protein